MEKIFRTMEKILPEKVREFFRPAYHYAMALAGALIYGFPSRKIKVVGVTGTKGKSSVVEMLSRIFDEAGYKTASMGTIRFKIGDDEEPNLFKMTMPGRLFVQKFISRATKAGCQFIFMEMTSEGAKQFRHKFIDLDALIFTNLAPEHIESHGGYERYREAKLTLADALSRSGKKEKFMIANTDDKESRLFFERARPGRGIPYSLKDGGKHSADDSGIKFEFEGQKISSPLLGVFNIYNLLASAKCAKVFGLSPEEIKKGIEKIKDIPGRAETIKGPGFDVVVDYAHTPDSLRAIYGAFAKRPKICVLGNTGGGRDTWKRPVMGKIADEYCRKIILTNEDPYDESPEKIIADMAKSVNKEKLAIEMDRRKAVALAIKTAGKEKNAVVLLTGKGTDPFIMEAGGQKTPWSDKKVAKEELEKFSR